MKVACVRQTCLVIAVKLDDPKKFGAFADKVLESASFSWRIEDSTDSVNDYDLAKEFLAEEGRLLKREVDILIQPLLLATVVFTPAWICFPVEQLLRAQVAVKLSLESLKNIADQIKAYGWDSVSWRVEPGILHTLQLSEITEIRDSLNRLKSRIDRMRDCPFLSGNR